MNTKIRVSLSMIVKNEELLLRGCLESVRNVVDEISIVDTGSTDGTVRVAREFGARVSTFTWTGDFSEARNVALANCDGDWVLYLDADERLAPGQESLIRALVSSPSASAYNVRVRSGLTLPSGRTVQVMSYPRLLRRTPSVRFEGVVHEQVMPSILRAGGRIEPSALLIEHLGYDRGYEILKKKAERNLTPLIQQAASEPDDWYARLQIAKTRMLLQEWNPAIEQLNEALACKDVPGDAGFDAQSSCGGTVQAGEDG